MTSLSYFILLESHTWLVLWKTVNSKYYFSAWESCKDYLCYSWHNSKQDHDLCRCPVAQLVKQAPHVQRLCPRHSTSEPKSNLWPFAACHPPSLSSQLLSLWSCLYVNQQWYVMLSEQNRQKWTVSVMQYPDNLQCAYAQVIFKFIFKKGSSCEQFNLKYVFVYLVIEYLPLWDKHELDHMTVNTVTQGLMLTEQSSDRPNKDQLTNTAAWNYLVKLVMKKITQRSVGFTSEIKPALHLIRRWTPLERTVQQRRCLSLLNTAEHTALLCYPHTGMHAFKLINF